MVNSWLLGGTVLAMDSAGTVIQDGAIGISQGKITFVGSRLDAEIEPESEVVSAEGCLVLPGLINGHTHLGMAMFRGIVDDKPLDIWLNDYIFPLERKWASPELVYFASLLSGVELLRTGTTLVNDMYYFGLQTAKALHEVGVRSLIGRVVIENHSVEPFGKDFAADVDRFLERTAPYPLTIPVLAPHGEYTVGEALFSELLDYRFSRGLRLHVHLSETEAEVRACRERYGLSPVEVFERWGVFEGPTIAAHGVVLSDEDIEILARNQVGLVHNPESNLKLGTAIAPVTKLRAKGCAVALGTDSVVSNNNLDLFQEGSLASKLQAHVNGPGSLPAESVVRMWTCEGARALGVDAFTGSLEVGKSADLITVQLNRPHAHPIYDPYFFLVHAAHSSDVRDVWVAGKQVMADRKIRGVEESKILQEATVWAKRIAG